MTTYRIKTLFLPEWPAIFEAVFGKDAQCQASLVDGNVAYYSFNAPQTPADLGPLVQITVVDAIPLP